MRVDKLKKWWSESFDSNKTKKETKKETKKSKETEESIISDISDEPFCLNFNDRIISKSIILYFDENDDNKLRADFLDEEYNTRTVNVLVLGTDDKYHYIKAINKSKHNKNPDLIENSKFFLKGSGTVDFLDKDNNVLTCKNTNFEFVFDDDGTLIESKHD